jgi:hypothetical protein
MVFPYPEGSYNKVDTSPYCSLNLCGDFIIHIFGI